MIKTMEVHTMDKIIKRLGNLLSVKSLVTLTLTAVFAARIPSMFLTEFAVQRKNTMKAASGFAIANKILPV